MLKIEEMGETESETGSLRSSVSTEVASIEENLEIKNRERGTYNLISFLSKHLETFDVPENITSDIGPDFASSKVQNFVKSLNIKRRLFFECDLSASTVEKLGIDSIERTLRGYVTKSKFLNYDGFSRASTRYRNTPREDMGTSPSNFLIERDLDEQLQAPTDISKVRKQAVTTDVPRVREHRHPKGEGVHSLRNLSVKNLAGSVAEFNSKEAHSLPDLTNISWRMDIGLDITNLSWRMKSGKTVGKLDSGIYLVRVGNGGRITENSAEFNITGTHSLTSFANLRLKETPGKVIEKLNFGNCLVIVDLRWREKPGKGVEKLYFNIYLASAEGGTKMTRGGSQLRAKAEGERKMIRGTGRISTSTVKEKVYTVENQRRLTVEINETVEMDETEIDDGEDNW